MAAEGKKRAVYAFAYTAAYGMQMRNIIVGDAILVLNSGKSSVSPSSAIFSRATFYGLLEATFQLS
jgi:hypothetical protein